MIWKHSTTRDVDAVQMGTAVRVRDLWRRVNVGRGRVIEILELSTDVCCNMDAVTVYMLH